MGYAGAIAGNQMKSTDRRTRLGSVLTWVGIALTGNLLVLWAVETWVALSQTPSFRGEYLMYAKRVGLEFTMTCSICLAAVALLAGLAIGGRRKLGAVALALIVAWVAHRYALYAAPFPMQPPHGKPWDEYVNLDEEELLL